MSFTYKRLDKNNVTLLMVDHQAGLLTLVRDFSPDEYKNFVVTDASGTFNPAVRSAAWDRMSQAGVQLMNWFSVAAELHRDWRNDVEGFGSILASRLPHYSNLMQSRNATLKES